MMNKLISQQAAIEAVENITSSMSVCVNSDECRGMKRMQKQAIAELENLPSAEQEAPDINVGSMDTTTHDSIPAKSGRNDEDRTSGDCISRQQSVDALKTDMASLDHIIKGMSAYDVRLDAYVSQRNQVDCDIDTISNLSPAQPDIICCKDCKHYSKHREDYMCGLNVLAYVRGNDFCSRAERREDT